MGRTQKQLADTIADELRLTTRLGRRFVKRFVELIGDDLVNTGRVELRGFGIFALATRSGRKITHPVTGKPIQIGAKKAVRFRASIDIRRRLNPTKPKAKPGVPLVRSAKVPVGKATTKSSRSRPR